MKMKASITLGALTPEAMKLSKCFAEGDTIHFKLDFIEGDFYVVGQYNRLDSDLTSTFELEQIGRIWA